MRENRIWNLGLKMTSHSLCSRYGILALVVLKEKANNRFFCICLFRQPPFFKDTNKKHIVETSYTNISVCLCCTGEAAVAHLRDVVPDEQRSAAEAGPVSDHSPPHRGAAHRSETGRRDPLLQLRDQPGSW